MARPTIDHAGTARQLLAGVAETPVDASRVEMLVAAEAHALLAVVEELKRIRESGIAVRRWGGS